jgi:hypothetical protein
VQGHARALDAPAHLGGVERDVAHALGAARDHQLLPAAAHLQAGYEHRLQPGAAAPVDLHAGHRHGQARVERDDAADRGRLAVRVAVAEHHVVDGGRVEPGPLQQAAQGCLAEFRGGERLQGAAVPADRGADRFADHDLAHGFYPFTRIR